MSRTKSFSLAWFVVMLATGCADDPASYVPTNPSDASADASHGDAGSQGATTADAGGGIDAGHDLDATLPSADAAADASAADAR